MTKIICSECWQKFSQASGYLSTFCPLCMAKRHPSVAERAAKLWANDSDRGYADACERAVIAIVKEREAANHVIS